MAGRRTKWDGKKFEANVPRKFKMGKEIIEIVEKKEMTYPQRDTLILYLHKQGYTNDWIAKCLGVPPYIVVMVIQRKVKGKNVWKKKEK